MHVLVVEDDRALGLFLQKGLQLEGHETEWVSDGNAAVERVLELQPELMVLDLSLPGRDGTEVLAALEGKLDQTSVLVLTGRSEVEERVRCLDLGADDVLLKPFSFHELTARCRAILRRRERFTDPVLRFGTLEMDRLRRTVLVDGMPVELTVKEFALLEFLMLRRGGRCTRAELLREVWHLSPESGTNVLDVYINYLRRKLTNKESYGVPIIKTVRGAGYCLATTETATPPAMLDSSVELARGA